MNLILLLTLAVLIAGATALAYDSGIGAAICILSYGLALFFLFKIDLIALAIANAGLIFWCALGYVLIAALWALFKWYLWNKKEVRSYLRKRIEWAKYTKTDLRDVLTDEHIKDFKRWWQQNYYRIPFPDKPPYEEEHRLKVIRWMGYWPMSLLETAFNHLLKELWNILYDMISSTLRQISEHVWSSVIKELDAAKKL